eukprot:6029163-Pyramimonas_sp.AAC.1
MADLGGAGGGHHGGGGGGGGPPGDGPDDDPGADGADDDLPDDPKGNDEEDDDDGDEGGAGGKDDLPKGGGGGMDKRSASLIGDFLSKTLTPYAYYSVRLPHDGSEDEDDTMFFQLLSLKMNAKIVPTVAHASSSEPGTFTVHIQKLEPWTGEGKPNKTLIDAYPLEDPGALDLFALVGLSRISRQGLRVWKVKESDIDGCSRLFDPEHVAPSGSKLSWPTLSLWDELEFQGWVPHNGTVHYADAGSASMYDRRQIRVGRRYYFLCLLSLDMLFERGAREFRSDEADAFFQVLLKYPHKATA